MGITTSIREVANQLLRPIGLEIRTTIVSARRNARLLKLAESGYFDRPAFFMPKCMSESNWRELLPVIRDYWPELRNLARADENAVEFTLKNEFFHTPDAEVLYAMVRHYKPKRVVEIGSGNSTKVIRQAILDGKFECCITSIDPEPRAQIDKLADQTRRVEVQSIPAASVAQELEAGDFLFIDSSHEVSIGNDCVYQFLQLIPAIRDGVIVHIHDIFLPWDYPLDLINREPISTTWSEQYLVQLLLDSGRFNVLWPGYYAQLSDPEVLTAAFPNQVEKKGVSLWIQKACGVSDDKSVR